MCGEASMSDPTDIDTADTIAQRLDPATSARLAEYMRTQVDKDEA